MYVEFVLTIGLHVAPLFIELSHLTTLPVFPASVSTPELLPWHITVPPLTFPQGVR